MEQTCSVPVCDLPQRCKGLCNSHYARAAKNGGDPGSSPIKRQVKNRGCLFADCKGVHYGHGYCAAHNEQLRKGQPLRALRPYVDLSARDADGNRFCGTCSQWLDPSEFHKTANTSDGLGSRCVHCRKGQKLLQNFNLSKSEYDEMLAQQGGGCAICGGANQNGKALSVDHDHSCCELKGVSCGECVRGLLCGPCNTAVGLMRDAPTRLRAAADYLERFGK